MIMIMSQNSKRHQVHETGFSPCFDLIGFGIVLILTCSYCHISSRDC